MTIKSLQRYFLCPGCKKVWTGSELRYSEGDCPDHGDICSWEENIESEELIPKARHTALVEAVTKIRDMAKAQRHGNYPAYELQLYPAYELQLEYQLDDIAGTATKALIAAQEES